MLLSPDHYRKTQRNNEILVSIKKLTKATTKPEQDKKQRKHYNEKEKYNAYAKRFDKLNLT